MRFGGRGLAHVELHDAVLNGNIEIVKATILRYIQKYPRKINEHDVSLARTITRSSREDIRIVDCRPWDNYNSTAIVRRYK